MLSRSKATSSDTCSPMPGFSFKNQQCPHFTSIYQDQFYKLVKLIPCSKSDVMASQDPVLPSISAAAVIILMQISVMKLVSLERVVPKYLKMFTSLHANDNDFTLISADLYSICVQIVSLLVRSCSSLLVLAITLISSAKVQVANWLSTDEKNESVMITESFTHNVLWKRCWTVQVLEVPLTYAYCPVKVCSLILIIQQCCTCWAFILCFKDLNETFNVEFSHHIP